MEKNEHVINYVLWNADPVRKFRNLEHSIRSTKAGLFFVVAASAVYIYSQNKKYEKLRKEIEELKTPKGE